MKRKIAIIFTLTLLMSACFDPLTVDQLTNQTSANYFQTPEEAQLALVGCYDGLQRVWSSGIALPVASAVMGDLTFGGTGAGDGEGYPMIDEHDINVAPGDNPYSSTWKDYYKGIFRCNNLLVNLDNVEWGKNEDERSSIEAQARFLRAYMYFDMVRLFGHIPLLTEPSLENLAQAPADEVYELIASDLLFAVENSSDTPYSGISGNEYGRVNKWAAEGLLTRVYMYYTGYYGQPDLVGLVSKAEALAFVEDIIANGGFSLVPEFSDLWPAAATYAAAQRGDSISQSTYAGETNPEVIFAIKYTNTSDYNGNSDGNHWMVMNGLRNESWGQYGYGNGWGACTVVPEVYQNWDSQDDRSWSSIMAIEQEGIDYSQINDVKEYTGYFTKKYTPTSDAKGNSIAVDQYAGVNFMIGQFQDYFSIRYADVLLMAAELGSANALGYLNEVQSRAGATLSNTVTKDIIFEERKLELAFEGHRYWDLLRYDNTLQYAAEKISYSGMVLTGGIEKQKVIDGSKLIITQGLSMIPTDEISLSNGTIKQNPGWE